MVTVWSPWTSSDGMLTGTMDFWLASFEDKEKQSIFRGYTHPRNLTRLGFSQASSYEFIVNLRNEKFVDPIDDKWRSFRPHVKLNKHGSNELRNMVNKKIELIKDLEKKLHGKFELTLDRLEVLRKGLDKLDAFID